MLSKYVEAILPSRERNRHGHENESYRRTRLYQCKLDSRYSCFSDTFGSQLKEAEFQNQLIHQLYIHVKTFQAELRHYCQVSVQTYSNLVTTEGQTTSHGLLRTYDAFSIM